MKYFYNLFAVTASCLLGSVTCQFTPEDLVVDVPDLGRIRGSNRSSAQEEPNPARPYIHFLNIRFANVVGRFQPSVLNRGPLVPEGEEYDATINTLIRCYQPWHQFQDEQCLSINVYTHKKYDGNDTALRPVIFFVHGGAFTVGAGSLYSGLRLMNRDVVYVSFNYRLGLPGWLSLQNDRIPGNAGLYDVLNALQWTRDYIKYFGGNPDLITVAGQSAGSAIVTHLFASPLAKGLFHRAIAASGSALNNWGTVQNNLQDSLKMTELLGCYNSTVNPIPNMDEITTCMENVPYQDLVDGLLKYQMQERSEGGLGTQVAAPVVQDYPLTHQKIIPRHPQAVFDSGEQANVPLLMGSTKHDGSFVLGILYHRFLAANGLVNDTLFLRNELVPLILNSFGLEDKPFGIYETVAKTYLGDDARLSGDFDQMVPGLMDIFSVFFFKAESYNTALKHSDLNNNTFWYGFDFRGSASLFSGLFPIDGAPPFNGGIAHGDDLVYLYSMTMLPFKPNEAKVSKMMLDCWANFAATGHPANPASVLNDWPSLTKADQEYLQILESPVRDTHYTASWIGAGLDAELTTIPPSPTRVRVTTTVRPTSAQSTTTSSQTQTTSTEKHNSAGFLENPATLLFTAFFITICAARCNLIY
ncbi:carboxylesterase 4A [Folsomia candida]|uniref:carboxylesterase 4A n=1 Tax=Folsomia candida TaxID=158441 RepID=UPI000B8FF563|nr:carboxylesterase 4A [Folsomia candida]